jgi:AP-3 complex subunit delta-1
MWERTLQDLIRGLRAHKSSPRGELEAFLGECVEEIRGELRGREMDLKAEGVVKMCYVSRVWRNSDAEAAASGKYGVLGAGRDV